MTEQALRDKGRTSSLRTRTYIVDQRAGSAGDGTADAPYRTIGAAASVAEAGDTIEVREGVYRERVDPPRGGTSEDRRILYRAAPGATVEIKGSDVVTGWKHAGYDCWTATVPNSLFGDFNPYSDVIRGDWYGGRGREFRTGCIYLDDVARFEAASREQVLGRTGTRPLWWAEVGDSETRLWAQFERDPGEALVEINVRQTIFYPSRTGIDYIGVTGFTMKHCANNWAPPTAEQVGMIGTNWSKGWLIADNRIKHARCSGIALGKHGDEHDNKSANSPEGYVETIERAHDAGWTRERIGHHIVRGNHISHCGQVGIVGSLGCAFSVVTGNVIHDIHLMQHFSGAEMAGIKFHAAIDTEIADNHIYRTMCGIWLDWMTQGTRVMGNLCHDNIQQDLWLEVNHGPFVVANNIFLSARGLNIESQGGAYCHNLLTGTIHLRADGRQTPYLKPHSTEVEKLWWNPLGDDRWLNNLIVGPCDMMVYDGARYPLTFEGNIYSELAIPTAHDRDPHYMAEPATKPRVVEDDGSWYLEWTSDQALSELIHCKPVTSERLGRTFLPRLGDARGEGPAFELANGASFALDVDYLGEPRGDTPRAGPIETLDTQRARYRVWPKGEKAAR